MGAAVRDIGVAINWRVTLLGLNLAAWLVGALVVTALFVHRDLTGAPTLYPGFGYSIPMFEDFPTLGPLKTDSEPVVNLRRIGVIGQSAAVRQLNQVSLDQGQDKGLSQRGLGRPRRLATPEDPGALTISRPPAH
jgi:hypothetical protein